MATDFEKTVRRLANIIGHGSQGAALARTLALEGIRTRADLRRPPVLARLPRESQSNVLFNPARNTPLATAKDVANEVIRRLVFVLEGKLRKFEIISVGSTRRQSPRVKDIDFLVVVSAEHQRIFDKILSAAELRPPSRGDRVFIADTYAAGPRRRSLILRTEARGKARAKNYRADLFITSAIEKPYALYHYTGSREYNIRTRAHAKRRGWLLNQYGLFDSATRRRIRGTNKIRTERDLANFIGVTYRAPDERNR